ncbi:RNA polymerase sigma factor [Streptomyces sp. NPDC101776]|uniref:RNA polymerase sigma factor n=1 Tax=Streptomyces sp. NPDC101776 TaxID=3366146 RepID=UPI0038003282
MALAAKWNALLSEAGRTGRTGRTGWPPGEDFQSFVTTRSGALFRGALVLTGSREAAEDLVQETLERACRRWHTIAGIQLAFFEQELVTAMNDFAHTSPAPHFDAVGIKSRTRRRRAGLIATFSAVIVVATVGTALATGGTGSHSVPAARTTTTKATEKGNVTTVPYVKPFDLKGF